jgi:hypothetical protein
MSTNVVETKWRGVGPSIIIFTYDHILHDIAYLHVKIKMVKYKF